MELQTENLQQTEKRKMSQNTSLKLVIKSQEKETKEERKEKILKNKKEIRKWQ